jgi:CheY-like chemotaxis protein
MIYRRTSELHDAPKIHRLEQRVPNPKFRERDNILHSYETCIGEQSSKIRDTTVVATTKIWAAPWLSAETPPQSGFLSPKEVSDERMGKNFRAYRVLLAEDNSADLMVVQEILKAQRAEFEIIVATDGQKAIQLLRDVDDDEGQRPFDIALIDLNLPKHTGHEVLAALRLTERCRDVPVIIVTSSRSVADVTRARELGIAEYFEKVPDLDAYAALGPLVLQTLQRGRSSAGKT